MAVSEDFADHVRELLEGLGPLRFQRMFGGAAVYADEVMFGLIFRETLFLKTDAASLPAFQAAGAAAFTFGKKDGTTTSTRFWSLPDEAADDPDEAVRWARLAIDAVLRGKKTPKKVRRADIGPGPWDEA